jgi:hypothetical protein
MDEVGARLARWLAGLAAGLALVTVTGGCGSVAFREEAAAEAARVFRTALAGERGAEACAMLAPRTRQEVEQTTTRSCADGLLGEEVPAGASRPGRTDVYGDQARVTFAGDTIFLAMFSNGWKVTAAGCSPRGDLPYDCVIHGG